MSYFACWLVIILNNFIKLINYMIDDCEDTDEDVVFKAGAQN